MKDKLVPWRSVRRAIHIAYNYVEDKPQDFDFISNVKKEELLELEVHCRLQIQYESDSNELDWGELLRFILIELTYRGVII